MISPINPPSGSNGINPQQADGAGSSKAADKTRRINDLREQIKNGSYTVNFEQLASALISGGQVGR